VKSAGANFKTTSSYVDATLLEYGFKFRAESMFGGGLINAASAQESSDGSTGKPKGAAGQMRSVDSKFDNLLKLAGQGRTVTKKPGTAGQSKDGKGGEDEEMAKETNEEYEKRIAELTQALQEQGDDAGKVKGETLTKIVDLKEIVSVKDSYVSPADDLQTVEVLKKNDKEYHFNKMKEKLNEKFEDLSKKRKDLKTEYVDMTTSIEQKQAEMDSLKKEKEKINERMKELIETENKQENRALIEKMKGFVKENETLKKNKKKITKNNGKHKPLNFKRKSKKLINI